MHRGLVVAAGWVWALAGCAGGRGEGAVVLAVALSDPGAGVATWMDRTPAGPVAVSPDGRSGAAMAFDPNRRKAVLVGGIGDVALGPSDETWEWDSDTRTWALVAVASRPPRLRAHRLAWFDGAIVLFGGLRANGQASGDLYRYTPAAGNGGATWTKVSPPGAAAPAPRWSHGLAVAADGELAGLVVQGGIDTGASEVPLDDSWLLPSLSSSWKDVTADAGKRPGLRYGHALFWDGGGLVLYGGTVVTPAGDAGVAEQPGDDTWTAGVSGGNLAWSPAGSGAPPARKDSPAVLYPTYSRAILFSDGVAADTWSWAGGWGKEDPVSSPPARGDAALTFDSARRVVLLFGGSPTTLRDTWEYRIDALPVVTAPATASGTEASPLLFSVMAVDAVDTTETIRLGLAALVPPLPSGQLPAALFPPTSGTGAAQGSFALTPGCRDHGSYTLTFQATDGTNTVNATTALTIADADCPPVFAAITPPAFEVGKAGAFPVSATDPDGDAVTYSMDPVTVPRRPRVAPTFDAETATFSWTPGPGDTGTFQVTFHAKAAGKDVPETASVTVTGNSPPVLVLPGPQAFVEGSSGAFRVSATDPDGDPTTLGFVGLAPAPAQAPTFDGQTGTFSWKPGFLDAGSYTASFAVTDGLHAAVNGTVSIVVANTDRPPALAVTPAGIRKSVGEGTTLVFTVTASDPDPDDPLVLTHEALPAHATAGGTGLAQVVTFTPALDQGSTQGTAYPFTFTASDGRGGTATLTVTVTVLDQNRAPVITPIPAQTVAEQQPLVLTISASDPDGQALVYSALALPGGATFDPSTHTFRWTPGCDAADRGGGVTNARFAVSDGIDTSTLEVPITVTGTVVRLAPASLSFPTTRVGTAATPLTATVTNGSARAGFTIVSVTTSEPAFTEAAAGLPAPLAPGAALAVPVGFHPMEGKGYAGTLTVTIDDPGCPTVQLPLGGVGQTTAVQVSRSGADFGPLRLGQASAPADFVVTNAGEAPITVTAVSLTGTLDFHLAFGKPAGAAYPVVLGPGEQVTFVVTASPTTLGLLTGAVSIATDLAGGLTLLPLSVVGVAPGLAVSDEQIDFGPVDVRGPGATRGLTITNYGTTTLTVAQPLLTGPGAAPFLIVGVGPAGLSLEPGRSASLSVLYQPTAESSGEPSAAVQFTSDAPDQPSIVVPLLGRGVDRHLELRPDTLAFGAVATGRQASLPVTVRNPGGAPLVFGSPAVVTSDPTFGVAGLPASLAAGASVEVQVTFTPARPGAVTATLTFASDDAAHPRLALPVSGTGRALDLVATPASLSAGAVAVGTVLALARVEVVNQGDAAHMITRVCVAPDAAAACAADAPFLAALDGPAQVAPQGRARVTLRFAPRAAGTVTAVLLIFADGEDAPVTSVRLDGEGVDAFHLRGGGGCGVAGGADGAGWAGVLLLLVVLRGRRRTWAADLVVVVGLGWAPAAAWADGAFDLSVFRPTTVPASSLAVVERPVVLPSGVLGLATTLDYARNPLYAIRDGAATRDTPVSDRLAGTLVVAYGLGGRGELAASLPLYVQGGQAGSSGVPAGSGAGLGDVALEARLAVVPRWLAVAAWCSLPTGDGDHYAGAGGVAGELRAVLGATLGRVRLAAQVGVRLRGEAHLGTSVEGSSVPLGLGASVHLAGPVDALGEVYGAVGLAGDPAASPLEGLVALRLVTATRVTLTAGGGAGLLQAGVGAADLRLFASLGFTVGGAAAQAPALGGDAEAPVAAAPGPVAAPGADVDSDGDGIPDRLDQCPYEPEDRDGFQDDDGCDDPDNDHDGIPDVVDQCPNQPETINGVDDDDGCPDQGEPGVLLLSDRIELLVALRWNGPALRPASAGLLGQVAATLRAHPEIPRVTIAVHVEPTRYPDRDRTLAQRRAEAIRTVLVQRGIPATRFTLDPVGSNRPLRKGLSERVEILLR